jgi:hypothetical protein
MLRTFEDRHVGLGLGPFCKTGWSIFRELRAIYEMVADAPPTASPEELRQLSCEAFAELFEGTDNLVVGEEHLPEEPGHIFIMNHLSNYLDGLFPDCFVPTLDTHFVSAMILHRKYGEAPVRVVRKSNPDEHEHRRYYDRLGHIYVHSRQVNPVKDSPNGSTPGEQRWLFLDVARELLKGGSNVVICPEGVSTDTENSPLPFRAGAFRLAAYVRPEPLLVPVAVANFDKEITLTKMVAVVHEPIRLSKHLGETFDDRSLHGFVNDYIYECFKGHVREAVQLGA